MSYTYVVKVEPSATVGLSWTFPTVPTVELVVWTSLGPLPQWVPGPTTQWAPGTTQLALHGT
jgi:hypothetical protein